MKKQLDLYIEKASVSQRGNFELDLIAELTERDKKRYMVWDICTPHNTSTGSEKQQPNSTSTNATTSTVTGTSTMTPKQFYPMVSKTMATNWLLALIAFLLFLMLCLNPNFE